MRNLSVTEYYRNPSEQVWLEHGYRLFADEGPQALKVERMAEAVGISKSSFYHHFADMEVFVDGLLTLHFRQAVLLAEAERQAQSIDPDIIEILLQHRDALLFQRQLLMLRSDARFAAAAQKADAIVGVEFIQVWVNDLQLKLNQEQLLAFFSLALSNFYLQLSRERLTRDWLSEYFGVIRYTLALFNG